MKALYMYSYIYLCNLFNLSLSKMFLSVLSAPSRELALSEYTNTLVGLHGAVFLVLFKLGRFEPALPDVLSRGLASAVISGGCDFWFCAEDVEAICVTTLL